MSEDSDIVLVETQETSVVVTPGENVVVIVVEEPQIITDEMQSIALLERSEGHVVSVGEQGPPGGVSGGIDDDIPAFDTTYSSMKIEELFNPFSITSFTMSPSQKEMGEVVTQIQFNWATNWPPETLSMNNGVGSIANNLTALLLQSLNITTDITYSLTAFRLGSTKIANASLTFLNRIYYGVSPSQTTNANDIKNMANILASGRARTITFNCTGGRYFHYAYPSRFGAATFKINGLTYTDMTLTVVPITNAFGFTENFNVYYCNVIQFGAAIPLVIS